MSLPNPAYIQLPQLQTQFWDKDLNIPLAGGYINFFQDAARTVPKDVFVLTQTAGPTYSYTDIGSVVTLSSVGTTQYLGTDSIIFLYPYDANGNVQLYYIAVYSSTNVLQFTRSAVPSGVVSSASTLSGFTQSGNIVSNPQFANVLFDSANGATFSLSGTTTTQIAPDWSIITTGTGSVTVNQIAITDTLAPGEPAYALDINSATISSLILSQRITNSPRILENNFASGTFIAQAIAPTSSAIITMNYVPSVGSTVPIVVGTAAAGTFSPVIVGTTAAIIPQTNTNPPGSTGYVDIQFVIPVGAHIQISCIQLLSVASATIKAAYIQESTPRQIDHLFHYYQNGLNFKPIPSLLTGWDFPLNPAQFGTSQTISTTPSYIWDQTICGSTASTAAVIRQTLTGTFFCTTGASAQGFYLLQYLSGAEALETTLSNLAVNVTASSNDGNVSMKVYLFYSSTGGTIPATATPIGIIHSDGTFTLTSSGWTAIAQPNGQSNSATIVSASPTSFGFTGFNGAANYATTTSNNFAIVVTFLVPTSGKFVSINSISCVAGDIPTRPAPQAADEVLRECQRYYEVSDPDTNGIYFSQNTLSLDGTPAAYLFSSPFELNYQQPKRVAPTIAITSLASTGSAVSAVLNYALTATNAFTSTSPVDIAISNWAAPTIGTTRAVYLPNTTAAFKTVANSSGTNSYSSGQIYFTYILNARLGDV